MGRREDAMREDPNRGEEAQKRSEPNYRELVENANSIILRLDLAGRITFLNRYGQQFFGYREEEILGRKVIGTIVPEMESTGKNLEERIREIIRDPESYAIHENENLRRNGERVWISWANRAVRSPEGGIIEILAIGTDVTLRRQAEEALRENQERYRALFNGITEAVFVHRIDDQGVPGKFIEVNDQACRLLGYSREDLLEMDIFQVGAPESKADVREIVGQLRTGRDVLFEQIHVAKDGRRIPVEIHAQAFPLRGKVAVLSVARDVAERRGVEWVLQESKRKAQKAASEKTILAEIGRIIGSTLNIQEVYDQFAAELRKLLSFDRVSVHRFNPLTQTATVLYAAGTRVPGREPGDEFGVKGTVIGEVVRSRRGLAIQGENAGEIARRFVETSLGADTGLRSMIAVPLISRNQAFGVLFLLSGEKEGYAEEDLRLAESAGAQIAGALANAELFAQRQRIERELKISEERYRRLVEFTPQVITVHHDQKYVYINPAGLRLLGAAKPEEIVGKSLFEVVHPDYWTVIRERDRQTIEEGKAAPLIEEKFIRRDGKVVDVEVAAVPIDDQEHPAILAVARDITDRKRAEDALRAQRDLLQALIDAMPIPVFYKDQSRRYLGCNRSFEEFFGRPQKEILGKTVYDLLPEDLARQYDELDLQLIREHPRSVL